MLDYGAAVAIKFASSKNAVRGMTPAEYGAFLRNDPDQILLLENAACAPAERAKVGRGTGWLGGWRSENGRWVWGDALGLMRCWACFFEAKAPEREMFICRVGHRGFCPRLRSVASDLVDRLGEALDPACERKGLRDVVVSGVEYLLTDHSLRFVLVGFGCPRDDDCFDVADRVDIARWLT